MISLMEKVITELKKILDQESDISKHLGDLWDNWLYYVYNIS